MPESCVNLRPRRQVYSDLWALNEPNLGQSVLVVLLESRAQIYLAQIYANFAFIVASAIVEEMRAWGR